jgi:hypothetical protein
MKGASQFLRERSYLLALNHLRVLFLLAAALALPAFRARFFRSAAVIFSALAFPAIRAISARRSGVSDSARIRASAAAGLSGFVRRLATGAIIGWVRLLRKLACCSGMLVAACAPGNVKAIAWNRNAGRQEDVTEEGPERCAFT